MKYIEKKCKHHGLTKFIIVLDGHKRCLQCRANAVSKRRKILKEKAIEYKGNACSVCQYSKCKSALEFHHTDPTKKDFGIGSKGYTRGWEKIRQELDKCIMVCANCHREIHEKLLLKNK